MVDYDFFQMMTNFYLDDADTISRVSVFYEDVLAISVVKDSTECGAKSRSDILAATHSEKTLPEYFTS